MINTVANIQIIISYIFLHLINGGINIVFVFIGNLITYSSNNSKKNVFKLMKLYLEFFYINSLNLSNFYKISQL